MSSSQEAHGRWLWLWNRLRCMTPAEVLHRAARALTAARRQGLMSEPLPPALASEAPVWIQVPPQERLAAGAEPYRTEASELQAGRVRLFERERFEVGVEPDWLRCPLTGVRAPLVPARRITITDRTQVGDIKYLWELNRHLQWVTLAQAWALEGDAAHLDLLRRQLAGWLRQNPPGQGPNYTSSLEAAIRLVNWSVVWQLLGGLEGTVWDGHTDLRAAWLDAIYRHVRQVQRAYSRHSSANNHLVGELCGVYVGARCWPYWAAVVAAGDAARHELVEQIGLQVHPDGVPAEQAFEYAGFIFDFFWLAQRCAAANGEPMPAAFDERLQSMADFARALGGRWGCLPPVGDADGAEALRLDPRPDREPLAALLEKQAATQGATIPPWVQARDDLFWLGQARPATATAPATARTMDFDAGGYVLFEGGALQGGMDVGPLGYLGIAAHGHADALQLWLQVAGQPLLIDPGTYAYWADKPWRDYFRGTAAHNTLQVEGRDQSLSGGRFMWTRHARARLLWRKRGGSGDLHLAAEHDGYSQQHQRELRVQAEAGRLEVIDRLKVAADAALHWHLDPAWNCELQAQDLLAQCGPWRVRLRVEANGPGQLELLRGLLPDEAGGAPLGWVSRAYGNKQSCPVLRWRGRASQWHTWITIESA